LQDDENFLKLLDFLVIYAGRHSHIAVISLQSSTNPSTTTVTTVWNLVFYVSVFFLFHTILCQNTKLVRALHLAPRAVKKPWAPSVLEELACVRICVIINLKVHLYPIQRL